jgi:hypothetical protein
MDVIKLSQYLAFLNAAAPIGAAAIAIVKGFASKELTKEENEQLLSLWSENRARSAANAGIDEE